MTPSPGYLHAETAFDVERERLRLLEGRYDAVTRARLAMAGPLDGRACLEVGAGAGSVALVLADAVGPDGRVVALDLDPRFLSGLDVPNLTVRRHDIVADPLERSCYDLVHCRALLLHLTDPKVALRRMVDALRPGGLLLVEDADFSSIGAIPGHAASEAFDRLVREWERRGTAGWSIDPSLGRKLPGLLADVGLVERGDEALRFVRAGGSPEAEFYARSCEGVRDGALPRIFDPDTDLTRIVQALRDPAFSFVDSLNVAAWGRRPMPEFFG
ncbi:MAG: methyltransferase domain-containing protein [Sporichthyaceae bacterium]